MRSGSVDMETSIVGLQRHTPSVDLDQLAIGLESILEEIGTDLVVSTEDLSSWLKDKISSLKSKIASVFKDWFFPVKLMSVSNLNSLSDEDKLRLVKRGNLEFYYYNPKAVTAFIHYIGVVKNFVTYAERKKYDEEILNTHVLNLIVELQNLIKTTGHVPVSNLNLRPHEHLGELYNQHKEILRDYIPPQNATGDILAVRQLVLALEENKGVVKRAERILDDLNGNTLVNVLKVTIVTILVFVIGYIVISFVVKMIGVLLIYGMIHAFGAVFNQRRQREMSVGT
jgi:hypothetical protein